MQNKSALQWKLQKKGKSRNNIAVFSGDSRNICINIVKKWFPCFFRDISLVVQKTSDKVQRYSMHSIIFLYHSDMGSGGWGSYICNPVHMKNFLGHKMAGNCIAFSDVYQ